MANKLTDRQQAPTLEMVYEAVCDLVASEQFATRLTVAEMTGLPLSIVDDRLKTLVNEDRIKRIIKGFYAPHVVHPPARAISRTDLPDGMVKLEIGDDVLTLTPREARRLAEMMAGAGASAALIAAMHSSTARITALAEALSLRASLPSL